MTELQTVIDTLDHAADSFDGIASKEQKKIYDKVLLLAKDLDTDASGKVKQSIANLKRLTQIKAHLAALSKDKEWVDGITQFAQYFGILQQQQNAYYTAHFPSLTLSTAAKQKHQLMKQLAVQNTMDALMDSGLKANVTDKLNDILLRAVTTNAKFADLQEELRAHLLGKDGGQGAFARYATTYATTALSQFTGQNNKLLTDDLDTEWFMYTGSNIETTRPFCEACSKKKYIHRSEIPELLKGHIHIVGGDDIDVPIYAKTGLPYGMIAGTTPENFQINCGGWNCRHQLVPVADAVVPQSIREEIEKKNGVKQSDTAKHRKQVLDTMKPLANKKVTLDGNGHSMSIGFSKYGNKHLYSDTFGRSNVLKKEDLPDIDKILSSATFVKKVGLSKERKDNIKRFYYYKTTLHGKTIYINVAETDIYRKGKGLDHKRFVYSITDKIK